jgi:putative intracellular protease/amidase
MAGALIAVLAGMAMAILIASGAAARPLVVILGDSRGAEAADLLAPFAILAESGAIEVKVVSATPERIRLTPGMAWLEPQMTWDQLAQRRERPDVVIVPALTVDDDPARSEWLRAQLRAGSRIMSICNGARVLAAAGLLDGRQATVHWYSRSEMERKHPDVAWRWDLRWVTDGPITTTAGISASEPAALDLLRTLAGDDAMRETAQRLSLPLPDQKHSGEQFRLTVRGASLVVTNLMAFWRRENVAIPLSPGFDERAFGGALDAWSRTYRSTAWAVAAGGVASRHGLVVHPSPNPPAAFDREVPPPAGPMAANFDQIRAAYGEATAGFVALQFEHPDGAVGAW